MNEERRRTRGASTRAAQAQRMPETNSRDSSNGLNGEYHISREELPQVPTAWSVCRKFIQSFVLVAASPWRSRLCARSSSPSRDRLLRPYSHAVQSHCLSQNTPLPWGNIAQLYSRVDRMGVLRSGQSGHFFGFSSVRFRLECTSTVPRS
jgi:hypothetical protein